LLPGRERVTLTCTAPDDLKIKGDGLLLALAVRNLVENALVHCGDGAVQVGIDADGSGGLRLTITDQGPGIPAEVLANFCGKPSDSHLAARSNGRTGLGLSIADAVVEAHGGRLVLENRPNAGGLAAISLPALQQA
jgi:signal transduction histidine kinase